MSQYTDGEFFLGREKQIKLFNELLDKLLNTQKNSPLEEAYLPHVIMISGQGGIGKTSIVNQYRNIVIDCEQHIYPFFLDWEELKRNNVSLQVDRESLVAESILDVLVKEMAQEPLFKPSIKGYHKIKKQIFRIQLRAMELLEQNPETKGLLQWTMHGSELISALVSPAWMTKLVSIGNSESKEKLEKALSYLRRRLKFRDFTILKEAPELLAQAVGNAFRKASQRWPLVIGLDTYETIDRADRWIRAVIMNGGPNIIWVIAGRNNLVKPIPFGDDYNFKGYADDEGVYFNLTEVDLYRLKIENTQRVFEEFATDRAKLLPAEIERVQIVTKGIPLAIKTAARIYNETGKLEDALEGNQYESNDIVKVMVERFQMHCINKEVDRRALHIVAISNHDESLLSELLLAEEESTKGFKDRFKQLERNYSVIYRGEYRLHDEPKDFFIRQLKRDRGRKWVKELNERILKKLIGRLRQLEIQLFSLEERILNEDWRNLFLRIADHSFWLNENFGWSWITDFFVAGFLYGRTFQAELVKIVEGWERWLSIKGKRMYESIQKTGFIWAKDEARRRFANELQKTSLSLKENINSPSIYAELKAIKIWFCVNNLVNNSNLLEQYNELKKIEGSINLLGAIALEKLGSLFLRIGNLLMEEGNNYLAEEAYRLLLKCSDKNPIGWNNLGFALIRLNRIVEAENAFSNAIRLDPKNPLQWNGLGELRDKQGRIEESIKAYRKSTELGPQNAYSWSRLGSALRKEKKYDASITAYRKAIDLNPDDSFAWYGLGNVYFAKNEWNESVNCYLESIRLDPEDPANLNGIGNAYFYLKRYSDSLSAFEKSIKLGPKNAIPWSGLATVYDILGDYENSIIAFNKSIEFDSSDPIPWNGLGNALRNNRNHVDSLKAYEKAIELDSNYAAPWNGTGNCFKDLGKLDQAVEAYNQAIDIDPKYAVSLNGLGIVLRKQGLYKEAIAAYQRSISVDSHPFPWNGLGNVHVDQKDFDQAVFAFNQSIKLAPNYAVPWNGLGNLYANFGMLDKSLESYRKAIEIDPQYATAWNGMGNALKKQGKFELSVNALKKAVEISPNNGKHRGSLINTLLSQSKLEEALNNDEVPLQIEIGFITYYNSLGCAYLFNNNLDKAHECFLKCQSYDSAHSFSFQWLSRIYYLRGQLGLAIAKVKKAIELKGDYMVAMEVLSALCWLDDKQDEYHFWLEKIKSLRKEKDTSLFEKSTFAALVGHQEIAMRYLRSDVKAVPGDILSARSHPAFHQVRCRSDFQALLMSCTNDHR